MVKIISDSTSDLTKELIDKLDISVIPLHILLGNDEYRDGIDITPDKIYEWADENKTTPKTSAVSIDDTIEMFKCVLEEDRDIVAFAISEDMSTTANVFRLAARELEAEDRIHVIDSENLSTGIGHLESLEKNGYIRRDPTKSRTIEIIDDNFNLSRREVVNIPLLGQVAAGQPLLAVENITEYFPIPSEYMPGGEVFMLKVKGDSMINMGIYEGDQIIVRKQNTASNGEVIVALVDDSATVKRFYKENGHIRLQPENDFMDPIIVDDCEILGKVIGLIRLGID